MEQISAEIRAEIERRLERVEHERGVRILFACESGSRAWGFPSVNSDYDVRFLYASTPDCYLSVFAQRDVIEEPIVDEIDLSGWDLRKTLRLLYRSNPALLEWLSCPIVYRTDELALAPLLKLSEVAFSPLAAYHHYLAMARQHVHRMGKDEEVKLKHYLYTLRPLLACQWILSFQSQPPMLFGELLEQLLPPGSLLDCIEHLVALKSGERETRKVPHVAELDDFISSTYESLASAPAPHPHAPLKPQFDAAFLEILHLAWRQ